MVNAASLRTVPKIRCRQIAAADRNAIVDLLKKGFGARRSRNFWQRILNRLEAHPAPAGSPKYGYLLESDGVVVGAILLIFTDLWSGDGSNIRCNVSSWYVEPAYRSFATLLASQALKYEDVTYLNISAAPNTRAVAEAQGYTRYSNGLFVALPALTTASADATIMGTATRPDVVFEPFEQDLLLTHADYGCTALWCVTPQRAHPFVFRPRLVKGLIPCAQLIYSRSMDDVVRFAGPLGRYLAVRGMPFMIIDANGPVAGLPGKYFDGAIPKYFKGPNRPRLGDLTFTEAAMFGV